MGAKVGKGVFLVVEESCGTVSRCETSGEWIKFLILDDKAKRG